MSFQKIDNKNKLLKLIDEFPCIESIEELASVVYIIQQEYKDRFSYEDEDFADFGPRGPISKKLFEDLFHLEVREKYIIRESRMLLTRRGRERVDKLNNDISFHDARDSLFQIDRRLWPKLAAYLYLRRSHNDEKAEKILKSSFDVDDRSWKILKAFINKPQS